MLLQDQRLDKELMVKLSKIKTKFSLIIILLIAIFFIKLPFIFHGKWDSNFFVPYMTDETCYSGPIYSFIASGKIDSNGLFGCHYPPFLLNLLLPYFWALFKVLPIFFGKLSPTAIYEVIYYNSRFFVLILATIGSYFWVKLFKEEIKSKLFQIVLLLLVNLNVLFFLYSTFIKADEIMWALGIISLYCGLIFWRERSPSNYKKFFLMSILPLLVNYHGYIYFLNFILVSLIVIRKEPSFNKKLFLFLSFICAPLIWAIANFEMFAKNGISGFLMILEETKKALASVPILIGANGYSSFNFYMDFTERNLTFPIIILAAFILFFFKTKSSYLKIVASIFAIFFVHLSLTAYRTDRAFLPVYTFFIFLLINLFHFFHEKFHKQIPRCLIAILTAFFAMWILGKTIILGVTLTTKDTRQNLYEYVQKNIPRRSEISFIHFTIAGAFSVSQKLSESNKEFKQTMIYIDETKKAVEQLSNLKGYFILSVVDYDILEDFKETKYYSEQYLALKKLIDRSDQIAHFDKYKYWYKFFGPAKLLDSFYGIHNPPLYLYRTKDAPIKEIVYRLSDLPYKISQKQSEEISIKLDKLVISTLNGNGKEVQVDLANWKTVEQRKIKLDNGDEADTLFISNSSKNPINLSQQYLGLDKNGVDLAYGFANKHYEGRELLFTTWVKANKPDCVTLGFYKGNINVFGWGESNLLGTIDNKYELLSYDGKFDNPYSMNGNIRYRINPGCTVELSLPQFFIRGELNLLD